MMPVENDPPDLGEVRRNVRDNGDVLVILAKIEAQQASQAQRLGDKVDGINDRLDAQNGRIGKVEVRATAIEEALAKRALREAREQGRAEGRSTAFLTRKQATAIGAGVMFLMTVAGGIAGVIVKFVG